MFVGLILLGIWMVFLVPQFADIMNKFKLGGHIDPDLFDIFFNEGVYLRYAHQFLDPWQIDTVDARAWA